MAEGGLIVSSGPPQLLVGLFPDEQVQLEIEQNRQQWLWPHSSHFPPADRFHLTLGYVDEHSHARCAERLIEAMSQVRMCSLELLLDYSCTWKNDVSVLEPAAHGELHRLRETIHCLIRQAGLVDRAKISEWKPHVTIARYAEGAACLPMSPISWPVSEIRVVRSHFTTPFHHEHLAAISARHGLRRLTASLH